ncbi:hypothetical protein U9203_17855 [Escherichia coli]
MTTPTRRISFYLKPAAVKNEGEACAWLRQHIHNDAHYASLMAVIREKEETLKQRVIRALAVFSGYGRVMVVGGGAEIVAPAIREACGVNATFIADGVPQFALVNGLYAMDKE